MPENRNPPDKMVLSFAGLYCNRKDENVNDSLWLNEQFELNTARLTKMCNRQIY
jgi:hypothetical protein